jgi:hypothetical protein
MRLTLLALSAFPIILAAASALADQTIDLPGGVPTPIPGTALTVVLSDVTDQRCPADVDCVWEGMIRAEITVLTGAGATRTFTLCNACDTAGVPQVIAGKTFALGELRPNREFFRPLSRNAILSDYTLEVIVSD